MRKVCFVVLLALRCSAAAVDAKLLDNLEWRSIGPAVMGGRISDLDGIPGDPATMFAAAGSGGLFVTHDGGITWRSIFDRQSTISIGAIAVQRGKPDVIWVGTGESNVRNSVSFGDGVYKSQDGGRTWQSTGLRDTQTISRIVINPKNPDQVYVAALGHPFGPNEERGVFATGDGGKTWRKSLYIDAEHGAADLEMDPSDPNTLYAGMWKFDRKPWTYSSGSEKGGVYRSSDAGKTWKKLTTGLPALMGRIGVKVAPSDPKTVYVVAETKEGSLFRSSDHGDTFTTVSSERDLVGRGYYFCDLRVAPDRADRVFVLADALLQSDDGGKEFRRVAQKVHGDQHAMWIDPKDPRRMWLGSDGGLAVTYDGAAHWEQVNNIPLGQFYRVSTDSKQPFYNVMGGLQDNGSWIGPSRTREPGGIFNDDWRAISGIVGFTVLSDSEDPDIVLSETPGGGLLRTDLRTREQQSVSPQPRAFRGVSASGWKYRFGWDAPLVRSPFGANTIYFGANVIFQSSDYGKNWENISPDLTTQNAARMSPKPNPISPDNISSDIYSTISAIAESPVKRGVLWAGTDDGNLQVSFNGGGKWTNVAPRIIDARVTHVEPSRTNEMTAYTSLERHMLDDFHPYIYKTTDGGQSWAKIVAGLPDNAFVWTIKEDAKNPSVLYAGTELGIYASISGGAEWFPLHLKNLPFAVAVRDIEQQPVTNDLIIATHGRSIWILDDAVVLEQLANSTAAAAPAFVFDMRPALRFAVRPTRFAYGDKMYLGANPAYGALISYTAAGPVKLDVVDEKGELVRELKAETGLGIHRAVWDLRYTSGSQALPGYYKVRITVAGQSMYKPFEVQLDPSLKVSAEDLRSQFETSSELRRMAATVKGTPQLASSLQQLATLVDAADAAPTAAMLRYFAELQAEYKSTMKQ